jgi:hypothetical protein
MLAYFARFALNPIKSRRNFLLRALVLTVLAVVAPAVVNWCVHPRGGFAFDFSFSGFVIVIVSAFILVFWVPILAAHNRARWQRERYLSKSVNRGQVVRSVYLTPNLLDFIEREAKTRLSPYAASVSVISTPSSVEFWSGGGSPIRAAAIDFTAIDLIRFVEDDEGFLRPEVRTSSQTIPLYAAIGWLGISRRSSKNLYDQLTSALERAKNSAASGA